MAELENEKKKEKVLVPMRMREQKAEPELPEKASKPERQWEMPRKWHTYYKEVLKNDNGME